ncbi:hypothetical protein LTS10_012123 [Elasticomyces elasticus]|nr:hypothetical protein LTS10_012123 [Elasticomyces elasticus]
MIRSTTSSTVAAAAKTPTSAQTARPQPSPPNSSPSLTRSNAQDANAVNGAAAPPAPAAAEVAPGIKLERALEMEDRDFRVKRVTRWRQRLEEPGDPKKPKYELQFLVEWESSRVQSSLLQTGEDSKRFVLCDERKWYITNILDDRDPVVWLVAWESSWRPYHKLPNAAECIDIFEAGRQRGAHPQRPGSQHGLTYGDGRLYPGGFLPLGLLPPSNGQPRGAAAWTVRFVPGKDYAPAVIQFYESLYPANRPPSGYARLYLKLPTRRALAFTGLRSVDLLKSQHKCAMLVAIKGSIQPRE